MKQDMEEWFRREATSYLRLRERFEGQVVRWVYSETPIWTLGGGPFNCDGDNFLPNAEGAFYACGCNAANQPVVLKEFCWDYVYKTSGPGVKVPTHMARLEEFVVHNGEALEVVFCNRGIVDRVFRLVFRERLLMELESFGKEGYQLERYQYRGRRKILEQSITANGRIYHEIAFGPNGEQTNYNVTRDGTRLELGKPLPKGMTVKKLKEAIQARLKTLILEIVRETKLDDKIYCVGLIYDNEGNDAFPPEIAIGLESERVGWMREHGERARDFVWNPAEFKHYPVGVVQLAEDEELSSSCDYLNTQLASTGSTAPAAKLLIEVAAELNKLDWPKELKRTDDFIVYAVDLEGGDLKKNLKKTVSAKQMDELKVKGLI